jgi:hypothetical protein
VPGCADIRVKKGLGPLAGKTCPACDSVGLEQKHGET